MTSIAPPGRDRGQRRAARPRSARRSGRRRARTRSAAVRAARRRPASAPATPIAGSDLPRTDRRRPVLRRRPRRVPCRQAALAPHRADRQVAALAQRSAASARVPRRPSVPRPAKRGRSSASIRRGPSAGTQSFSQIAYCSRSRSVTGLPASCGTTRSGKTTPTEYPIDVPPLSTMRSRRRPQHLDVLDVVRAGKIELWRHAGVAGIAPIGVPPAHQPDLDSGPQIRSAGRSRARDHAHAAAGIAVPERRHPRPPMHCQPRQTRHRRCTARRQSSTG